MLEGQKDWKSQRIRELAVRLSPSDISSGTHEVSLHEVTTAKCELNKEDTDRRAKGWGRPTSPQPHRKNQSPLTNVGSRRGGLPRGGEPTHCPVPDYQA